MEKPICEVCGKENVQTGIKHMAGFPERIHMLCSENCLRTFLKMEDDEMMDGGSQFHLKNRGVRK